MAGLGKIPQPGLARIHEPLARNELQNSTTRIWQALVFNELHRAWPGSI
jgi:hypothetical protein